MNDDQMTMPLKIHDGQPSFSVPVPPPVAPVPASITRRKVDVLDDLEDEAPDDPYVFSLRGQEFAMISPNDADWIDITSAMDNPRLLVHVLMNDGDRMRFLALPNVKLRTLRGLMERYQKHFGLGTEGESDGSARS